MRAYSACSLVRRSLDTQWLPAVNQDGGGVIAHLEAAAETLYFVDQGFNAGIGAQKVLHQAARSVFFILAAHRLSDSVGVQKQSRARR